MASERIKVVVGAPPVYSLNSTYTPSAYGQQTSIHTQQAYDNVGAWTVDLFGCFSNCAICLIGCYLPCITFGQTNERIKQGSCLQQGTIFTVATHVPIFISYGICYAASEQISANSIAAAWGCPLCLLCFSLGIVSQAILVYHQRARIRDLHSIKGDKKVDFAAALFCPHLSLIQHAAHLERLDFATYESPSIDRR